jgi:hypothetical protein
VSASGEYEPTDSQTGHEGPRRRRHPGHVEPVGVSGPANDDEEKNSGKIDRHCCPAHDRSKLTGHDHLAVDAPAS